MKRKAFGAIDLLIGLVLISVVFIIGMQNFKPIPSTETTDLQTVKEQVNEQVKEIEQLRQNAKNYEQEMLDNNNF